MSTPAQVGDQVAGRQNPLPLPAELDHILSEFRRHHGDADISAIVAAYEVADAAHKGQRRLTGDPYITHPLAVTGLLAEIGADASTLVAGLLHDVVEDTEVSLEQVAAQFGEEVALVVDGVTKIDKLRYSTREESHAETIRKMVVAMAADTRVIVLKLADRLHNLRTISVMNPGARKRIGAETLEVYAPLAGRLGIETWKHELQDRAFAEVDPNAYRQVQQAAADRSPRRGAELEEVANRLRQVFEAGGVVGVVEGREKHLYSIWRKMVTQKLPFEHIYDLIGLRLVCETEEECYRALGLAHSTYPPVPGRFFDYVAMPKPNGYQSLHTTLVGPSGRPFELQIRTSRMHRRATYGVAAHWMYKESPPKRHGDGGAKDMSRRLADVAGEAPGGDVSYFKDLTAELAVAEEVYVLTPAGEPVALAAGATPVDFAYRIHTEVGHACRGARVNGRLVPLHTPLQTGDQVEIITTRKKDASPSPGWLEFVVTAGARSRIRRRLEETQSERWEAEGQSQVWSLPELAELDPTEAAAALRKVAADVGYRDVDQMFRAVGGHKTSLAGVAGRLGRILGERRGEKAKPAKTSGIGARTVVVAGLADVPTRMAACCLPEPGTEILGYVTVSRGVSVHRASCMELCYMEGERLVVAWWSGESAPTTRGWLRVRGSDRPGLLAAVSDVISTSGANIFASGGAVAEQGGAVLRFGVEVSGVEHLEMLCEALRGTDGVISAEVDGRS